MEDVMTEVNQKTEGLRTELYEAQKDLQVAKASLNTQRGDLKETIRDIKKYLELKLISFKDNTQNLISSKQDTMEAKWRLPDSNSSHSWKKSWPGPSWEENRECAQAWHNHQHSTGHLGLCSGPSSRL
jgi:hypothetical protein